MTEKRFAYIKNSSITQYQSIPIQKIGKGKPFHCQGLVDELNKLWNENEQLKERIKELEQEIEKLDTFKKILEYAENDSDRVDWQSYCEKEFEGL